MTTPSGLREALTNLVRAVDALEARSIRSGGEFHVWAEERMVTEACDEARAVLAATPKQLPACDCGGYHLPLPAVPEGEEGA